LTDPGTESGDRVVQHTNDPTVASYVVGRPSQLRSMRGWLMDHLTVQGGVDLDDAEATAIAIAATELATNLLSTAVAARVTITAIGLEVTSAGVPAGDDRRVTAAAARWMATRPADERGRGLAMVEQLLVRHDDA
jgi:hypothetical protein